MFRLNYEAKEGVENRNQETQQVWETNSSNDAGNDEPQKVSRTASDDKPGYADREPEKT